MTLFRKELVKWCRVNSICYHCSKMSSYSRSQRGTVWVALMLMAIVWAANLFPPFFTEQQEGPLRVSESGAGSSGPPYSVDSKRNESHDSTSLQKSPQSDNWNLFSRVEKLENDLITSNKAISSLQLTVDELRNKLENLEDSAFSDGSNALIAVMENTYFAAPKTPWVKLCGWENCQFQTRSEVIKELLKKYSADKLPSSIRVVQISVACPVDDAFSSEVAKAFGKDKLMFATIETNLTSNCTTPVISEAQALAKVKDKSLDMVVIVGNGKEDVKPTLLRVLKNWTPKTKIGGITIGQDYIVSKPYTRRWKNQDAATPHQKATKIVVDNYRTGDDNELGQDNTVTLAGDSVWYFTKIKATLFGG